MTPEVWIAVISGTLGVIGLGVTGFFAWLSSKDAKANKAELEGNGRGTHTEMLERIDQRVEELATRVDSHDDRLEHGSERMTTHTDDISELKVGQARMDGKLDTLIEMGRAS